MSASLQELIAQRAALEDKIAEVSRKGRDEAIAKVRALMAEFGLTVADLGGRAAAPKSASSKAGIKVAPKYRDNATGNTWTGRGIQPTWLRQAIAGGATLDSFKIAA